MLCSTLANERTIHNQSQLLRVLHSDSLAIRTLNDWLKMKGEQCDSPAHRQPDDFLQQPVMQAPRRVDCAPHDHKRSCHLQAEFILIILD